MGWGNGFNAMGSTDYSFFFLLTTPIMLSWHSIVIASGLVGAVAGAPAARQEGSGFVTVKGNTFQLDGEDFYFAGSNGYYFPFSGVRSLVSTVPSNVLTDQGLR